MYVVNKIVIKSLVNALLKDQSLARKLLLLVNVGTDFVEKMSLT